MNLIFPDLTYRIRRDLKTPALLLFICLSIFLGISYWRAQQENIIFKSQISDLKQNSVPQQRESALMTETLLDKKVALGHFKYVTQEKVFPDSEIVKKIATEEAVLYFSVYPDNGPVASLSGQRLTAQPREISDIFETKVSKKNTTEYNLYMANKNGWKQLDIPDPSCGLKEKTPTSFDVIHTSLFTFNCALFYDKSTVIGLYKNDTGERIAFSDPNVLLKKSPDLDKGYLHIQEFNIFPNERPIGSRLFAVYLGKPYDEYVYDSIAFISPADGKINKVVFNPYLQEMTSPAYPSNINY